MRERENARASVSKLSDSLLMPKHGSASNQLACPQLLHQQCLLMSQPGPWAEPELLGTETILGKPSAQGPDSQVVFALGSYSALGSEARTG